MGKREIALYLLGKGARIDLFAEMMLGKLEIVNATINDDPKALHKFCRHPGVYTSSCANDIYTK